MELYLHLFCRGKIGECPHNTSLARIRNVMRMDGSGWFEEEKNNVNTPILSKSKISEYTL